MDKIRSANGKGLKVKKALIVDDHEEMRDMLKMILEDRGYHLSIAVNGKEALEVLHNSVEPFFLLITDFNMPYMNGDELIEEVMKRGIDIKKIVVMSGEVQNTDIIQGLLNKYPRVSFVPKPSSVSKLLSAISME